MLKRRAALAIARDLRRAERIVEGLGQEHDPDAYRDAERLIAGALHRMIATDEPANDYAPALALDET